MGVVLAKFRKEQTTEELLEKLDERIQVLESYMHNTEEQKKSFVSNFLAISIGVYVLALVVVYFRHYPSTWKEVLLYIVPLLLAPFVIFRLRRVFTWYFQRKLNKNSDKLIALRAEKRKILEQVMDKETYKVAVGLLARFGEKTSISKPTFAMTPRLNNSSSASSLRIRNSPAINAPTQSNQLTALRNLNSSSVMTTPRRSLLSPNRLGLETTNDVLQFSVDSPRNLLNTSPVLRSNPDNLAVSRQMVRRQTPFPIINQHDKSVFERIVDVLIGDGPQDRFAMICKECFAHNGMAPKDEFDYVAFRCAFCNAMNAARKERPVAPRLSMHTVKQHSSTDSSSSSDEDKTVESRPVVSERALSDDSQGSADSTKNGDSIATSKLKHDTASLTFDTCSEKLLDNNNESELHKRTLVLQKKSDDIKLTSRLLDELKKEK